MTPGKAKEILIIYRPDTADANDPEIAEALALARGDSELQQWLDEHCARQKALRDKFRQIALPVGLREQIISEYAASTRAASRREKIMALASVAAILLALALLAAFYWPRNPSAHLIPNTLANYQDQMMSIAQVDYYMAGMTNLDQVQSWMAQNQAPSDYVLPAGLKNVAVTGCTLQMWRDAKISMICFRAGKTLPPGQAGDLWLFVINQTAVNGAPATPSPQFANVDGLITATWTQDGKLYLLGTKGDEQAIKKYL